MRHDSALNFYSEELLRPQYMEQHDSLRLMSQSRSDSNGLIFSQQKRQTEEQPNKMKAL